MFKRNRTFVAVRIALIVVLIAGIYGVIPVIASTDNIMKLGSKISSSPNLKARTVQVEAGYESPTSLEDNASGILISTPLFPIGINSGESKLVSYNITESNNISGTITSRTFQFFTQYDVPLSEPLGPFPANITINSSGANGWNEFVYLPNEVVNKARSSKDYAIVLKTTFKGNSQSGIEFSATASLLLLLPPAKFSKASPANGAVVQPTGQSLQWDSSIGAVDYEYCFDTIDNNSCDTNWVGTYDTNVALQNLPLGTTFYWQVRANNTSGTTYANNRDWWEFETANSSLLVVTKVTDTNDGVCDNDCSLREAIVSAFSGYTITFHPSLSGQTITLGSTLVLNKDLIIDGSNLASKVEISGNSTVRVFNISSVANVTLNNRRYRK